MALTILTLHLRISFHNAFGVCGFAFQSLRVGRFGVYTVAFQSLRVGRSSVYTVAFRSLIVGRSGLHHCLSKFKSRPIRCLHRCLSKFPSHCLSGIHGGLVTLLADTHSCVGFCHFLTLQWLRHCLVARTFLSAP